MYASRLGFLAGLIIGAVFGFPQSHPHQGKHPQRPLEGAVRLASLDVGQRPSGTVSVTARRSHSSAVGHPVIRITHAALVRWTKVAICEEGGWTHVAHGPVYWGSLGWLDSTWQMFRAAWMPTRMDQASVAEQVWAAQRFAGYYHLVPDQYGCTGGY